MQHKISAYIGITTPQKGYSSQQRELFSIDPLHVMEANILADGHLKADRLLYAARAKLDTLGAVKAWSCIVNNPTRIKRTQERLQVHEMEGDVQLAQQKEREGRAAKDVDTLRPVLKEAIELYVNGNHGRRLEKKLIRAILLLVFEETPHRSNAKKEEMLNQLKLLDRNDTENKIQKVRHEEEHVSPDDERADSASIFSGGVGNGGLDDNRNTPDSSGPDNVDEVVDASEEDDEGGVSATVINDWDRSKGNNLFGPIPVGVLNEGSIMTACRNAFDLNEKCIVAKCSNCITCDDRCAKVCKCRGRTSTKTAKDLSDDIVNDWKLGKVNKDDPNFRDMIFSWPVSCIACGKFISKEVETMAAKEVQADKERKMEDDPKWVPRDWETLRKVVQGSWLI